MGEALIIHSVINPNKACHSCESRNPGKHWIPGQARNDKLSKTFVVVYRILLVISIFLLPTKSFSAEAVKLRYVQSIYVDEKGIGIKQPEGVASNDKSLLIVGDTGNDRLLQFTVQEKSVKAGPELKIPQLSSPIRVQINSKGEIFALDGKKRRIIRLNPDGTFKGYVDAEGVPSPSTFVTRSFKIDTNDNIYILDIFSARVLILNPEGKYQREVPFPKDYGFFSDLSVDSKGNLMLVDSVKAMVFSAQKDSNSFSPLTKSLREYLNFPTSMTTDNKGMTYLVDENGGGIVILGRDGSYVGRQLTMGWNEGFLYYPSQMSINDKGEAFIADRGNSRVQVFTIVR